MPLRAYWRHLLPPLTLVFTASLQRVNHFKNHYELTRKDLLVKNVNRMKKQLERADAHDEAARYAFLPQSYVLPGDYGAWLW